MTSSTHHCFHMSLRLLFIHFLKITQDFVNQNIPNRIEMLLLSDMYLLKAAPMKVAIVSLKFQDVPFEVTIIAIQKKNYEGSIYGDGTQVAVVLVVSHEINLII